MLKRGIKWHIGNGESVGVWTDNWLPTYPPTAPTPLHNNVVPSLKVNDLFLKDTSVWDIARLKALIHPMDISLIQNIRPSITGAQDRASWIYSSNGAYTVKSGYNLLRAEKGQSSHNPIALFKSLWRMQFPSKLKHFWWRVLHNALLVAFKLKQRTIINDSVCSVCGEKDETVNHLLFQCRVSKEVWDLVPIKVPSADMMLENDLIANYSAFMTVN